MPRSNQNPPLLQQQQSSSIQRINSILERHLVVPWNRFLLRQLLPAVRYTSSKLGARTYASSPRDTDRDLEPGTCPLSVRVRSLASVKNISGGLHDIAAVSLSVISRSKKVFSSQASVVLAGSVACLTPDTVEELNSKCSWFFYRKLYF